MGFLSFLGDLGKGLVKEIPIVGPIAGAVGSALGKQQQGKATGAIAEANAKQAQDRNAIAAYQAAQQAQNQAAQTDLERQQFGATNRAQTAKQALIGSLLGGGYQPTTISIPGVPQANVSGGLARNLLANPAARQAMSTLASQASTAQNTPLSFQGGNILPPPTLTPLPNVGGSGALSNIADIGQIAGAAAPSFMAILKRIQQQSGSGQGTTYGADDGQ